MAKRIKTMKNILLYLWQLPQNLLGLVVIAFTRAKKKGHQKQSLYLGWLYLLVIGLPSATGNLLNRVIDFDYYKQPWESWADRLGCVVR